MHKTIEIPESIFLKLVAALIIHHEHSVYPGESSKILDELYKEDLVDAVEMPTRKYIIKKDLK